MSKYSMRNLRASRCTVPVAPQEGSERNLPSGNLLRSELENHHAINGKIHYKWPFSITMLNYQRVPVAAPSSVFPTSAGLVFSEDLEAGTLPQGCGCLNMLK